MARISKATIASSLLGVLAQRLVRRTCPNCRTPHEPTESDRRRWGLAEGELESVTLYRGGGCGDCMDTGYRERVGIFELLAVTEPIRELILQRSKASTIKQQAVSNHMTTLRADGIAKVAEGATTMDEVARVTGRDEF